MASTAIGMCSACAYSPVAFNAVCCPRCGAPNKVASLVDRYVGRGMLTGMAGGILTGAVIGALSDQPAGGAFAGALVGALVGLVVGLFIGLVAAVAADLVGRWSGRPPAPAGGLIVPVGDLVRYCGRCLRPQVASEGEDCLSCGRRAVVWDPVGEPEETARRRWEDEQYRR